MVEINIKDNGSDRYTYESSTDVLGRMYDNNAESIVVNFPESEIGHTCTMIVVKGIEVIDHIDVEDGEPVSVTDTLSQFKSLNIGFSFSGTNGYIKNSESKKFKFLDAECPHGFVPQPPQQTGNIDAVIKKGFAGIRPKNEAQGVYEFTNIFGEVVGEFEVGAGGGIEFETDPTVPSFVKEITEQDIEGWNNKVDSTTDNLVNYYLKQETYTRDEVNNLIAIIKSLKKEIVDELPTENIDDNTIYLVPKQDGSGNDYYSEYLYISGQFEFIGSTQVDLTDYVKNTDYGTSNNGGVAKYYTPNGVQIAGGFVYTTPATPEQIRNKSNGYVVITPTNNKYAVIDGIAYNSIALTDEEKASAQSWLGIDALVGDINTALEEILGV